MLMLVIRRLLMSIVLIVISSLAVFVLMSLVPGSDPARTILGDNATPESIARLNEQLGLNKPLWEQYLGWLTGLLHGDLGTSIYSGEPVTKLLGSRVAVTFSLMAFATLTIAVFGIALGIFSALGEGWVGRTIDALSLVGFALPGFWIAVVFVFVFSVNLGWFPATGFVPPDVSVSGWLQSLVLPVTAMAIGGVTGIAKQMRDSARGMLEKDFVRVLRSTGLSESRIITVHVLRNAAIPTTTLIGLTAVSALGGAVFIENVFVMPGLGQLITSAASRQDLPVILGVGVAFTSLVILINLLVDVAYATLNPKVRQTR